MAPCMMRAPSQVKNWRLLVSGLETWKWLRPSTSLSSSRSCAAEFHNASSPHIMYQSLNWRTLLILKPRLCQQHSPQCVLLLGSCRTCPVTFAAFLLSVPLSRDLLPSCCRFRCTKHYHHGVFASRTLVVASANSQAR